MGDSGISPIEEQIVDRFHEKVASEDAISSDIERVLNDLSTHEDFGGRERIATEILAARGYDED